MVQDPVDVNDGGVHFILVVLVTLKEFKLNSVAACINESLVAKSAKTELEPYRKKWTVEDLHQEPQNPTAEHARRAFHYKYNKVYEEKRKGLKISTETG